MYIPNAQSILTAGLALCGGSMKANKAVSSGSMLDYYVPKCIDDDGNKRCSTPFLVSSSKCYNFEWSTDGALSHTTVEVRDAGSDELVFYRDTNGEWEPKKGELVYLDFKPKIAGQGNKTVEYKVKLCDKE